MKIGIESESFHLWFQNLRMDIFQFIEKTYELGLDGIIINVVKDYNLDEKWGALGKADDNHLNKIKSLLNKYNMFIEIDMRNLDYHRLVEVIEVAHKLGARIVRTYVPIKINRANINLEEVHDIVKIKQDFDPESLEEAVVSLKKILPVLQKYRIKLALENHEYETSFELVKIIKQLNSPWIRLLYDFGNSMMAWEDPNVAVKNMAPYVVSTHCKDHIIIADKDSDFGYIVCGVPLGQGNIDIRGAFDILYRESAIESINIEMCYPYCAEFKRSIGTGGVYSVGSGAFKVGKPLYPVKPQQYYYPQEISQELLEKMLEDQMEGVESSVKYVRDMLKDYE